MPKQTEFAGKCSSETLQGKIARTNIHEFTLFAISLKRSGNYLARSPRSFFYQTLRYLIENYITSRDVQKAILRRRKRENYIRPFNNINLLELSMVIIYIKKKRCARLFKSNSIKLIMQSIVIKCKTTFNVKAHKVKMECTTKSFCLKS